MLLSELINGDNGGVGHVEISGLAADSRAVRPGYLFAALPGHRAEGTDFIADAVAQGAVAVLAPTGTQVPFLKAEIKLLYDANPRRRLAQFAAKFYAAQPKCIGAVTGTNGKTSVVDFARQIWRLLGLKAASIGTLGIVGDSAEPLAHTTPDPVTLHKTLARLANGGVDHLAIEASSHGLHQHRLDGVDVGAAAFTNLSRDHLDYHASADRYFEAKLRLFDTVMAPEGHAVLNADSPEFERLHDTCVTRRHDIIAYGRFAGDIRLRECRPQALGQDLRVSIFDRRYDISLGLVGEFQAYNVMCALGLVITGGADLDSAVGIMPSLKGVPGRVEQVARHPCGSPIYVDYAHTPNALENVLHTLRRHTERELVVVFGCGGDRDRVKRGEMGGIAAAKADRVFVTDDNPRTEDPAFIRRSVLDACPDAEEIGDRAAAIHTAVQGLRKGDILVVAGKGHETGQIVGDHVIAFDDRDVVREAVAAFPEGDQ